MDFKQTNNGEHSGANQPGRPGHPVHPVQRIGLPKFTMAKMRLATYPEAAPWCLKKLACHNHEAIVIRVAEHGNTEVEVLEQLAKHKNPEVRIAVSENVKTPLHILLTFVNDECVDVRYSLAENHNIPVGVLSALFQDENPYVSSRAQQTLNRLKNSKLRSLSWLPVSIYQQEKKQDLR